MKRHPKPITNIIPLPYPRLGWVYDPGTGYGPLHIADSYCQQNGDSRSYTRCKKAIGFHHYFNNGITNTEPTLNGRRLCKGCGSEVEFAEALEAHLIGNALQREEYRKRRAEEEAQNEKEYQERLARVGRLKQVLNVGQFIEARSYLISFEHEGFRYHVTEDGPISVKGNE